MDIDTFEKEAFKSLLFSAPVFGSDLDRFLKEKSEQIKELAKQAVDEKVEHIYWVGAGNSRVNLLPGISRVIALLIMNLFGEILKDWVRNHGFSSLLILVLLKILSRHCALPIRMKQRQLSLLIKLIL